MRIGILAGTGFGRLTGTADAEATEPVRVETPYGARDVAVARRDRTLLFFLNRHAPESARRAERPGAPRAVPAHRIDHRRNIEALRRCRVETVLSLLNSGALRPGLQAGDLVVPHDLVDLSGAIPSLHDDAAVHVDLSEPYCPHARDALLAAAGRAGARGTIHPRGVYVGTRGPRLETPAEVAHLAGLGDLVGMTGTAEAVLAREAGMCHAALAFVANPAAGLARRVEAPTIRAALAERAPLLAQILLDAAAAMPEERACGCRDAPRAGRLEPAPLD